jgi:LacI family transcriptional regulator
MRIVDRPGVLEVARKAGVSPATVSRVLNDSPLVKQETRARIQRVLDEMNYMRNGAARALSSRRSRTIGLIVPVLGTAVFAEALQVIQSCLQAERYSLLTAGTSYDADQELRAARTMIEHGVDGIILVGTRHDPALIRLLKETQIPAVQIFAFDPQSPLPCVGFDNYQASYDITDYLVSMGHRRLAIMHSHARNNDRIDARFEGIKACLRNRGLKIDPDLVVEVGFTIPEGRGGLREILSRKKKFTALACTGDVVAVGALLEARAQQIDVPADLSISGFHDIELASQVEPPLTTVHAPIEEMAKTAVNLVLATLDGTSLPTVRNLPTSIIVRKSVGPAPVGV